MLIRLGDMMFLELFRPVGIRQRPRDARQRFGAGFK
jgi:hypothetical protein